MQETLSNQTNLSDAEELLECHICGMRSNSLGRHIVAKHDMSTKQYKEKFPGAETNKLTQKQIDKMAAAKRAKDSKHKQLQKVLAQNKIESLKSGLQLLTCCICGFQSPNSLISHITRKHSVTMHDYRTQYPDCVVQQASPACKRNSSKSQKKRLEDPDNKKAFLQWRSFPSEIKHWTKKGYTEEQAIEKVAKFQRIQSLKGNNELTRAKRSEKNTGDKNPMSLESISRREGVTIAEAHALTPCYGRTGEQHPMFGKKHTDEALDKIGSSLNHSGRSKIEHEMSNMLIECYGGEKNKGVGGWSCDYVNKEKRFIVEFFGDYWHMNPKRFAASDKHPLIKKSAVEIWERDARKLKELDELGYTVVVIWESDWRFNKETCTKRIKDAYDRTL